MKPPRYATDPAPTAIEPSGNNSSEIWWDKQEVMNYLHISDRTLQYWRTENLIPYSRIRGKIFYNKQDVLAMLQKGKEMAAIKKNE